MNKNHEKNLSVKLQEYEKIKEENRKLNNRINSLIKIKATKEHNWNELKEYLKDYKDVLENQKDSVEGLDLFEEHTLDTLEEVLNKMQELEEGGNND